MTEEFKFAWEESRLKPEPAFTPRALVIGIIFGCLFAIINAYQSLTIGLVTTAAMISSLAMYGICYLLWGGRRDPGPKEIVTAYNIHQAAAIAYSMYPIAVIYLVLHPAFAETGWTLPDWIVPNPMIYSDVINQRIIFHSVWLQPLSWMLPLALFSGIAGLMIASWFRYQVIEVERLVFPYGMADAEVIKGVTTSKNTTRANFLFLGIVIGLLVDFVLNRIPTVWPTAPSWAMAPANNLRYWDLTGFLSGYLPGSSWVFLLSIGIIGLGMIMPASSSLSMALGAFLFYVVLPPIMIKAGIYTLPQVAPSYGSSSEYFKFPFGLSLGTGILLSATLIPVILKWGSFVRGMKSMPSFRDSLRRADVSPRISVPIVAFFFVLVILFLCGVLGSSTYIQSGGFLGAKTALILAVFLLFFFFLELSIGIRTVGETGFSPSGIVSTWLYGSLLSILGYRGFEPYYVTSGIIDNASLGTNQMEAFRVGYLLKAKPLHQYIASLFGWTFGWIISTLVMFLLWSMYGTGSEAMPMSSMEAQTSLVLAIGTGKFPIMFRLDYLAYGIVVGAALVMGKGFFPLLPIVPLTFGLSAWIGVLYTSAFLVGGVLRIILSKMKGQMWYEEKGIPLAAGLLAGSALSIFFSVCIHFLKLAMGGG